MRRGIVGLTFLLLLAAVVRSDDKDQGWVQLFNGKDLTGWKTHPDNPGDWKVEEGVLVGRGKASHLFSERGDYKNFHFRIEAQINDKGNSGQYARAKFERGFPAGYEAQINATGRDPIRTGSLYPDGRQKDMNEPKTRKQLIVLEALHKPDEWFTQEIICVGDKITILVNGQKTVEWTDPKHRFKSGHLALQQHDPGTVVKFRKLEVKELPE